jgi:dipeptidase D
MITEGLEPERLWYYFEEISQIPRASRNEQGILDYLLRFAHKVGIEHREDGVGNIVMFRPVSEKYAGFPAVVIQSHVDMVCEKNASSAHDFNSDPIILKRDGDWIRADGTSLGADNGIGVAAMLAMLADPDLELWPMEFLFTVEEEIGLNGAMELDTHMISGKMLINLDTEEVGTLYIGCAGGRDSDLFFPMNLETVKEDLSFLHLGVTGLRGGHSGAEIHLGGANAVKLLARVLNFVKRSVSIRIASISGGDKDNAIPREATAVIAVKEEERERVERLFADFTADLTDVIRDIEPEVQFHFEMQRESEVLFDPLSSASLVDTLMVIPHGILGMSRVMEDLVETSSNLSSIHTGPKEVRIHASHRSSLENTLSWVAELHGSIAGLSGARIEQDQGYPGWNPDPSSKLLAYAREGVQRIFGQPPAVRAIHAGLECGVIKDRFKEMDAISMGPTIRGAHSPDERVHIDSVSSFWKMLIETLRLINSH